MTVPRAPTKRFHKRILNSGITFLILTIAFLLLSSTHLPTILASDGELDANFGSSGKTVIGFYTGGYAVAQASVLQPDGKIVLAGMVLQASGMPTDFGLARFNGDGSLDTSFGSGGKVTSDFLSADDEAYAIALQPDGKIIAGGSTGNRMTFSNFALARYNSDGSLDSSFGDDGRVITPYLTFMSGIRSIAIQPDGKILAIGYVFSGSVNSTLLVRYKANGKLDRSFGTDGMVMTDYLGFSATCMAVQPDGKIVLAGSIDGGYSGLDFGLMRYNSDGSLDLSFNSSGKVITVFSMGFDAIQAISLQTDGRIVCAGKSSSQGSGTGEFALARYHSDGTLDATFGVNGKVLTDIDRSEDAISAVMVQRDGRIVAAGSEGFGDDNFALVRYQPDGSLDETFGSGGKVITDFYGHDDEASSLLILPNGSIFVAGTSAVSLDIPAGFALACYQVEAIVPVITGAEVNGKKLYVYGKNFDSGAELLMNGVKQKKTFNDEVTPNAMLVAKKSGRNIAPGETVVLQVRNSDGKLSNEWLYQRPNE